MRTRRTFGTSLALLATLLLGACLGGSTAPVNVTGVYELQTVNGKALPYVFTNGVTITKEVITINHDGSFTDVTTRSDGTIVSDQGAYTNFSGTLNFADATQGIVYQGFVSGNNLSVRFSQFTMEYIKTAEAAK